MTDDTESEQITQSSGTLSSGQRPVVPPERLCTAVTTGTKQPCKVAAIKGGTVCVYHGGRAPQVREAAQRRLLEMVDLALKQQMVLLLKADTPDAVKLKLTDSILDRVGMGAALKIEADINIFDTREELMARADLLAQLARQRKEQNAIEQDAGTSTPIAGELPETTV